MQAFENPIGNANPDSAPWLHRKWNGGLIRPSFGLLWVFWLFGIVFTSIGVVATLNVPEVLTMKLEPEKLVLLFPTVGILFLFGAVIKTLRMLRFRGATLRLESMPGVIGGRIRGNLQLPQKISRSAQIRMQLLNEATVTRRSGGETTVTTQIVYQDEQVLALSDPGSSSGRLFAVPFSFTIPWGEMDETDNHKDCKYNWKIRVEADVEGLDLDLEFKVPVYKTPESDKNMQRVEPTAEELDRQMENPATAREIQIGMCHGHTSYVNSGLPKFGMFVMMIIVTVIFSGATGFLGTMGVLSIKRMEFDGWFEIIFHGMFTTIPLIMCVPFGLVSLLLVYCVIAMFIRRETWVENQTLCQRSTLFGFSWDAAVAAGDINRVYHKKTGSIGTQNIYSVYAEFNRNNPRRLRTGTLEITSKIRNENEGKWLVKELKTQLGLNDSADAR